MLVFEEKGKLKYQGKNGETKPHMASNPGIDPGLHWWKASALALRQPCSVIFNVFDYCTGFKSSCLF